MLQISEAWSQRLERSSTVVLWVAVSIICVPCESQQENRTPAFSHEQAVSILATGCGHEETWALPASGGNLIESGPIDGTFMRVEVLRGLPELSESSAKSSAKEFRAAVGFGCVYPQTFLRLVVDGEQMFGDLFAWWPTSMDEEYRSDDVPSMAQIMAEENCRDAEADSEIVTCRYCLNPGFDWRSVLSHLDEQGAWVLPDESELPEMGGFVLDGVSIEVELVSDGAFRTYSYGNPDHRSEPEAKAANAILRFIENMRPEVLESEQNIGD